MLNCKKVLVILFVYLHDDIHIYLHDSDEVELLQLECLQDHRVEDLLVMTEEDGEGADHEQTRI